MTTEITSQQWLKQTDEFETWAKAELLSVQRVSAVDPDHPGPRYQSFVTRYAWRAWLSAIQQSRVAVST